MPERHDPDAMPRLHRELGVGGAMVTGLGSIIGTGVFVSIAVASGLFGWWVLLATPLAAVVATFNGLSSAQLAAAHPVAGGTYEYGYRLLGPWRGFTAGWLFLAAKSASAATAALGLAGYGLRLVGADSDLIVPVAIVVMAVVTAVVARGIRFATAVNVALVSVALVSLAVFVVAAGSGPAGSSVPTDHGFGDLFAATAFLFVAYTGYGRIATLGEEVRDPRRTIPRAVVVTLIVSAVVYTAVAAAGWYATRGVWPIAEGAPLAAILDGPAATVVEVGAVLAMLGVIVNLVLGLSRVWLAMGRRGDMPAGLSVISNGSPTRAVLLSGAVVLAVALVGDVRVTWSFSAFTVLLYYAITNWAALRLEVRQFPRWVSWAGLAACAGLAFFVEPSTALVGVGVVAAGWLWRAVRLATSHN
ncbi:MAG: APC family permease [Acidimicrobiia bacterium]|nr:APC family permease [Acidimicrobiia bacterium]